MTWMMGASARAGAVRPATAASLRGAGRVAGRSGGAARGVRGRTCGDVGNGADDAASGSSPAGDEMPIAGAVRCSRPAAGRGGNARTALFSTWREGVSIRYDVVRIVTASDGCPSGLRAEAGRASGTTVSRWGAGKSCTILGGGSVLSTGPGPCSTPLPVDGGAANLDGSETRAAAAGLAPRAMAAR